MLATISGSYDPRLAIPACWGPERIVNQGTCGACYAFASSLAYSTRLCKATHGVLNVAVSEQRVVSCLESYKSYYLQADGRIGGKGPMTTADGCDGGNAVQVWLT